DESVRSSGPATSACAEYARWPPAPGHSGAGAASGTHTPAAPGGTSPAIVPPRASTATMRVADVRLAPRHVFVVSGIHQIHLKTALLQHLEQRNPVDSRRFHRHGPNPAGLQPVGDSVQLLGNTAEGAHRFGVPLRVHRHVDHLRADIDSRCVRADFGSFVHRLKSRLFAAHLAPTRAAAPVWQIKTQSPNRGWSCNRPPPLT